MSGGLLRSDAAALWNAGPGLGEVSCEARRLVLHRRPQGGGRTTGLFCQPIAMSLLRPASVPSHHLGSALMAAAQLAAGLSTAQAYLGPV